MKEHASRPPTLDRREVLRAGTLAPFLFRARRLARRDERPNLLFIHTDQQSLDTLSALGCPHVSTPGLDRLVGRGLAFRESYSADPVCMPARAAWYTGRPPSETGVFRNGRPLLASIPDLGQWLRKGGYETVYAGKWHVPGRELDQSFRVLAGNVVHGETRDRIVSEVASAFLRGYDGEKPFFLSVGLLQPHDINYWFALYGRQGSPLLSLEKDELPPLPPSFLTEFEEPRRYRTRRLQKEARLTRTWSEANWRTYLWIYYRFVEMVDAEIARVLAALEASAHAEDTLVLFSSDHGEALGAHGFVSKSLLYEPAVKVPFAAVWPGRIPAGALDGTHLVSGLDVAPTLCDYAGVEPPPLVRGASLRPLFEGKEVDWRSFLVAEDNVSGRMVRSRRYKLIRYEGDPVELFFDLESDPWETRNLAGREDLRAELERHRSFLEEREATLVRAPVRAGERGDDEDG